MTLNPAETASLQADNFRLRAAIGNHRERIMSLGLGKDGHGTEWDRELWFVLEPVAVGTDCVECEGTGWACQPPRCHHPVHVVCPWCHGSGVAA